MLSHKADDARRLETNQSAPPRDLKLVFRRVDTGDIPGMWRLANEPGKRRNSYPGDATTLERFQERFQRMSQDGATVAWVSVSPENASVVAYARYDSVSPDTVELDFAVEPSVRRQGIGTEIVKQSLAQVRDAMGVNRVLATVFADNVASIRVLTKLGFTRQTTLTKARRTCVVLFATLN